MTTQRIIRLGLMVFSTLTLMSFLFFRERIGHIDMAFQTFLILKSGGLEVQSGRFGAIATQFWPWLAQSLGLPLKAVMMAYSWGHVLWPALLFVFCIRIGQARWALALLLGQVLMTTQTFWWLSEMPQGLPFLLALFAWLDKQPSLQSMRIWQWPLWMSAAVTAFYFHPLILWPALFLCFYLFLPVRNKWPIGLTVAACFAGVAVGKYFVLKPDWYDVQAMARAEAFARLWPHWFDLKSHRDFVTWSVQDYYWLPVCWVINIVWYATQKKGFLLVLTAFFQSLSFFWSMCPTTKAPTSFTWRICICHWPRSSVSRFALMSYPIGFQVLTNIFLCWLFVFRA